MGNDIKKFKFEKEFVTAINKELSKLNSEFDINKFKSEQQFLKVIGKYLLKLGPDVFPKKYKLLYQLYNEMTKRTLLKKPNTLAFKAIKTNKIDFKVIIDELKKINLALVDNNFNKMNNKLGDYLVHLERAYFTVQYEIKKEQNGEKKLELIYYLSFELIKALKECTQAFIDYINLNNYLNKPFTVIKEIKEYSFGKEFTGSVLNYVTDMLKNIGPIYLFLKEHVKTIYKNLESKENEIETKNKDYNKKTRTLNKFLVKEDKYSDYADVYIKVLRNSKRKPTLEALYLASHKTISVPRWQRKLKHPEVIKSVTSKIANLINDKRLISEERKKFYKNEFNRFYKLLKPAEEKEDEYLRKQHNIILLDLDSLPSEDSI